jgi:transcriptional regulator GlxA family with amidase domain
VRPLFQSYISVHFVFYRAWFIHVLFFTWAPYSIIQSRWIVKFLIMSLPLFSTILTTLQWHIVIIKKENIQTQTQNFISVDDNFRETEQLSHIKCFNCGVQKHESVNWLCVIHNRGIVLTSCESMVVCHTVTFSCFANGTLSLTFPQKAITM